MKIEKMLKVSRFALEHHVLSAEYPESHVIPHVLPLDRGGTQFTNTPFVGLLMVSHCLKHCAVVFSQSPVLKHMDASLALYSSLH